MLPMRSLATCVRCHVPAWLTFTRSHSDLHGAEHGVRPSAKVMLRTYGYTRCRIHLHVRAMNVLF